MSDDVDARARSTWLRACQQGGGAIIALGRPATQDTIPMDPDFAASLLVLREWLHHLGFANIQVLRSRV